MGIRKGFCLGLSSALFLIPSTFWGQPTNKSSIPRPQSSRVNSELAAAFQVQNGFRLELVAPQAMVASPVAMAFDENGRLFVAEMRDYPDRRARLPHMGRIRLLEDTDGDGVFDSSIIYADDLALPSAIACYDGGVFIAATPDILYFKDLGGHGVADLRKVVFTGFGTNQAAPDPEALLNNFVWGLDNQIHGGAAGIGGEITAPGAPGAQPVLLGQGDFSFDPRALTLMPEIGGAQTGLSFDNSGRRFVSDLEHPLRLTLCPERYLARNPFIPQPPQPVDVMDPAREIFQFSGERPVAAAPASRGSPPANAGTGSVSLLRPTRMSKARSCLIYRGSAFPSNYVDTAFVADPEAHIIHHGVLTENGLVPIAQRPAGELRTEFVVGKDSSFHPSQLMLGPDGALYIADMQTGGESGRIFRLVPEGFKQPKRPQLGKASTYELVSALAHANGWQRDTAARLLYQRADPAAVGLVTNMFTNSRLPQARLQALHVLDGIKAINESIILRGLRDPDERVRQHSIALVEHVAKSGTVSDFAWARLAALAEDSSPRVRYQLALTLGELNRPVRIASLASILNRDGANPWFQTAVLSSVIKGTPDLVLALGKDSRSRNTPAAADFLRRLSLVLGLKGQQEEVVQVLDFITQANLEPLPAFNILSGLGEGLHRIGSSLALVDPQTRLQPFYDQALAVCLDVASPEAVRIAALRLRGVSPYTGSASGDILQPLVGSGESEAVQSAAIAALGQYDNPAVVGNILAQWPTLTPTLRRQALQVFLTRTNRMNEVVQALESGIIAPTDLSSPQADFLRTHGDQTISQRALRILGAGSASRPGVLEQFKEAARPGGVAARGRDIFRARCAVCHHLNGEGALVGPELGPAKLKGRAGILSDILQPKLQIAPGYATYILESSRGETYMGVLADENPVTVTLHQPRGQPLVWPRLNMASLKAQSWSMMPEGLEAGLTVANMSDLLEYIMTAPR